MEDDKLAIEESRRATQHEAVKAQVENQVQSEILNASGGEGGIRTHGTVSRSQHFQCCQFNHSCTSPKSRGEYEV